MEIDADVRSLYNNVFGEMDDNVEREKLYNELIELKVCTYILNAYIFGIPALFSCEQKNSAEI